MVSRFLIVQPIQLLRLLQIGFRKSQRGESLSYNGIRLYKNHWVVSLASKSTTKRLNPFGWTYTSSNDTLIGLQKTRRVKTTSLLRCKRAPADSHIRSHPPPPCTYVWNPRAGRQSPAAQVAAWQNSTRRANGDRSEVQREVWLKSINQGICQHPLSPALFPPPDLLFYFFAQCPKSQVVSKKQTCWGAPWCTCLFEVPPPKSRRGFLP